MIQTIHFASVSKEDGCSANLMVKNRSSIVCISIACMICRMALAGENRSPRRLQSPSEVLKLFSPKNLKTRGYLRSSGSMPQSIPEVQFQQEFYHACCNYTKSAMITLPECGTPKGRINFFIPSKKWGIELLCDGDRLLAHNERFVGGEYGKWVQAGMMDDYIMIDFRSTVPIMKLGNESSQLRRQSFIRIADLKCLTNGLFNASSD